MTEGRRRQWHPTPVLFPGKSHGQRSLVGCSPWGHKESDTTERLHFHFLLLCIGGGNGNLLQWSCLENLRDGGAWWAAVYGVTQSRTRLKCLSSSSSIHTHTHTHTHIYLFEILVPCRVLQNTGYSSLCSFFFLMLRDKNNCGIIAGVITIVPRV